MKQNTIDTIIFLIKSTFQAFLILIILFLLLSTAEIFINVFTKDQVKEDYKYHITWPNGDVWKFQTWDKHTKWYIIKSGEN